MAKLKVSELVAATATNETDELYLVQNGTSKKITVSNFFADISNPSINGNVKLSGTPTVLSSPGYVSLSNHTTFLNIDAVGGNIVLPNGSTGQIKMLLANVSAGGTYTLSANVAGNKTIRFANVGDTATLMYTDNKWFVIGGTASIT